MGAGRTHAARPARALLALALLGLAACGRPAEDPLPALAPGEWREFEGSWSAVGTRESLQLQDGKRASILHLKGSVMLVGKRQLGVGFQAEVLGFADGDGGFTGRCTWTDARGDRVWSALEGQAVGTGNRVRGSFTGGTGRFAGVTGEYAFEWQYVIAAADGEVSGRAVGLSGRARVGGPADEPGAPPPPAGGPPR